MTKLFKTLGIFGLFMMCVFAYPIRSYGDERTCWNNIGPHVCEERCREQGLGYDENKSCITSYVEVCDTCCCVDSEGGDDDEDCECTNNSQCTNWYGPGYECNCTCNAKRYSISYDLDGGTGVSNTWYTVEEGEDITLPTPTRDGYDFSGWYEVDCVTCE